MFYLYPSRLNQTPSRQSCPRRYAYAYPYQCALAYVNATAEVRPRCNVREILDDAIVRHNGSRINNYVPSNLHSSLHYHALADHRAITVDRSGRYHGMNAYGSGEWAGAG